LFIKNNKQLLTDKSTNFQVQQIPRVRQLHKIGGGKVKLPFDDL